MKIEVGAGSFRILAPLMIINQAAACFIPLVLLGAIYYIMLFTNQKVSIPSQILTGFGTLCLFVFYLLMAINCGVHENLDEAYSVGEDHWAQYWWNKGGRIWNTVAIFAWWVGWTIAFISLICTILAILLK